MNTYSLNFSLPSFWSRYMELSNDAFYKGAMPLASRSASQAARCEYMYMGAEFAVDASVIYLYTHQVNLEIMFPHKTFQSHKFLINGAIFEIIDCCSFRQAAKVADVLSRLSDGDLEFILDDCKCGVRTYNRHTVIFGNSTFDQISTFLKP